MSFIGGVPVNERGGRDASILIQDKGEVWCSLHHSSGKFVTWAIEEKFFSWCKKGSYHGCQYVLCLCS